MVISPIRISLIISLMLSSPCKDAYIIQIPNNISIAEDGSIDVVIVENDLNQYQTLYIDFDDEFTISDSHGKDDISGYTVDSSIVILPNDMETRSITYHLPHIPSGSWSGSLGLSIRLDTHYPSNTLISGSQLNQIIASYAPAYVEFSHDVITAYDNVHDVSMAQDGSIMLYVIDSEDRIIISNGSDADMKANEDMSHLFKDVTSLSEIRNIDMLDLSECLSMSGMFWGANRISSISGLSSLDTKNIIDMSHLFEGTTRFRNIDLSSWDVANVKDMSFMFAGSYISDFSSIEEWDTGNVINMSGMFSLTRQVTNLDLSDWDVLSVQDMSNMFSSSRRLTALDLSSWNTCSCRNMSSMFESSQSLSSIQGISSFDTHNTEDMSSLFSSCIGLGSLDLEDWEVSNVLNMSNMFNTTNLSDLGDISGWDVGKVKTFSGMFENCTHLITLGDVSSWEVSEDCTDLSKMFKQTGSSLPATLILSNWDVSNVTTMSNMFYGCKSLEYLDITGWDTSNLVDTSGMFEYNSLSDLSSLRNIIGIDLLETGNLRNMSRMFMLNRFVNVDLSSWNTQHLQDISYAFAGCYRQDLDKLKHWDVSSVLDMSNCFSDGSGSISGTAVPDWYIN